MDVPNNQLLLHTLMNNNNISERNSCPNLPSFNKEIREHTLELQNHQVATEYTLSNP